MYGRTIGTLNVYVKGIAWSMSKVWSKTGNDTNIWNVAQVTIKSRYRYQVCPLNLLNILCNNDRGEGVYKFGGAFFESGKVQRSPGNPERCNHQAPSH